MRRAVGSTIVAAITGLVLALFVTARWALAMNLLPETTSPSAELYVTAAGFSIAAVAGCALWAALAYSRPGAGRLVAIVCSVAGGVVSLAAMQAVYMATQSAADPHGLLLSVRGIDALALDSLRYSPPPALAYLALAVLAGVVAGAISGLVYSMLLRVHVAASVVCGSLVGGGLGVAVVVTALTAFFASMSTGRSLAVVFASVCCVSVALFAGAALAWRANAMRSPFWLLRLAPLLVLSVVGARLLVANYGADQFFSLARYHADVTYTYIQFVEDGTWRRTLDRAGSRTKLWRCRRFLTTYPSSAYRPAAMLAQAECQFELWDFPGASETLESFSRDYPSLGGYPEILRAMCDLAAGRPSTLLRAAPADSLLSTWRTSQGALMAARAAAQLAQPNRAAGYYSQYVDFLRSAPSTSSTAGAVRFAYSQADAVLEQLKSGGPVVRTGSVSLRLYAGNKPIRNARVVLVQPHHDAALPADSNQFTGAWSALAWNAVSGVSDGHGCLTISGVPYGTYELVLGLDLWQSLRGHVVSDWVPPVTVDRPSIKLPDLRLVPAIRGMSPPAGGVISPADSLAWSAYPGAASYSATLVILDSPRAGGAVRPRTARGQTCWARSGIRACRTPILSNCFVNGFRELQKGATYMWVVYAYRADGKLLSSSEHYYDLQEPTLTVR